MSCTFCWQRCSWRNFETFQRNSDESKTVEVQELGSLRLVLADQLHHDLHCSAWLLQDVKTFDAQPSGTCKAGLHLALLYFSVLWNYRWYSSWATNCLQGCTHQRQVLHQGFSPRRAAFSTRCIFPNHGIAKAPKKFQICLVLTVKLLIRYFWQQSAKQILLIISKYCFKCREEKHATKR